MSLVTNVMISVSIGDEDSAKEHLLKPFDPSSQVFRRLTDEGFAWGGSKYPECEVWGAAFNYLDREALFGHLAGCGWKYPASLQVFIQEQGEDTFGVWMLRDGGLTCVLEPG